MGKRQSYETDKEKEQRMHEMEIKQEIFLLKFQRTFSTNNDITLLNTLLS
jgi:hypothetical protein